MSGTQIGHFGRLVVGDEMASREAHIRKLGAHHFGSLVIGDVPGVHTHGPAVTDKPVEDQLSTARGFDPRKVWGFSVNELRKLVDDTTKLNELNAWLAVEQLNPNHEGGRKSALAAIQARIDELLQPTIEDELEAELDELDDEEVEEVDDEADEEE